MKRKTLKDRQSKLWVVDGLTKDYVLRLAERFKISQSRAVRIAIQYSYLTSDYYARHMKPTTQEPTFEEVKGVPREPNESEKDYIKRIIEIVATPIFNIEQ